MIFVDQEEVYRNLLSLIEGTLLPSMSTLDSNACLSEEMWSLLKLMPYNIRYVFALKSIQIITYGLFMFLINQK